MEKQILFTTKNSQVKQAFDQRTDPTAPLAPNQFVVGLIQHPQTGLFQVWLSTNGLDITNLSAHRRIMDAEMDLQMMKDALGSQDFYDTQKLEALLQQLKEESDEQPQPFPESLVKQICQGIVVRVHQE